MWAVRFCLVGPPLRNSWLRKMIQNPTYDRNLSSHALHRLCCPSSTDTYRQPALIHIQDRSFISTLLAKQCWCLLMFLNAFCTQTSKGHEHLSKGHVLVSDMNMHKTCSNQELLEMVGWGIWKMTNMRWGKLQLLE